MGSSRRSLLAVIFIVLLCGTLGAVFGQRTGTVAPSSDTEIRDSLRTFTQVFDLVEQNYAEPVSADKAIYNGAIPGMLRALDPHSNFFDPRAYAQLREEQRGKYYGVGMLVGARNSRVIVISPYVGTPSYRAGLYPGDIIAAVDGVPTDNMSTSDVADRLKGPKGTKVRITILRQGVPKPLEFQLVRDEIPRYSVDLHFMISPGVGYMHISQFQETTDTEVQAALDKLGDISALVLDLRTNPGGLLSEGVAVADKFLKKNDVIVSHHGRSSQEKVYRAAHGNGGKDYPIVVLVNRGTASAAEILAGAIQDHDRGLVIGEDTFGKGLVQTVFPLSENAGLALTTAWFYTPSGRLIQRDYAGVSLYDYFYTRQNGDNSNREVKFTDSGRTVYGGGGITPDVKIPPIKATRLQVELDQKYVLFGFAKSYQAKHKITDNFEVTDSVLHDFRQYLNDQKVTFTEAELVEVLDWLKANIKSLLFIDVVGQQEGLKIAREADPQVQKALELIPKAKELADNAKKIIAERRAARAGNQ